MYFARHKELNLLTSDSHKIFRELIENVPVGVFMADDVHKLFYVNQAFDALFDFQNRDHALGHIWHEILFVDSSLKQEFLNKLNKNGTVADFQASRTNIHGGQISFLISARHLYSSTGEIIGIQGLIIDISVRLGLENQAERERLRLEQILSFYSPLTEITELDELADHIVKQTSYILETKRCSLMFIDDNKGEIYIKAAVGIPDEIIERTRIKIGEPVAGLLVLEPQPIMVNNIDDVPKLITRERHSYTNPSFMSAPIVHNNNVIGILNVSEKNKRFTQTDLKVLQTISQQSTASIHRLMTLTKLEELSLTDPLTGLYNLRGFNKKLEEEIARASRYNLPLSIMMIDVDNFKSYNDTYGHPKGNTLLKTLAEIFKTNLRTTEWICRYGGDEFGIILPSTSCAQSVLAASKLRDIVQSQFQEHQITLSIGVAEYQNKLPKDTFIQNADKALYQAKHFGRNQVFMWH